MTGVTVRGPSDVVGGRRQIVGGAESPAGQDAMLDHDAGVSTRPRVAA